MKVSRATQKNAEPCIEELEKKVNAGGKIEAHIFVAFQAYCLNDTLKQRLKLLASGLTPRAVIEKFKKIQMVDVHLPTTDGKQLVLTRNT